MTPGRWVYQAPAAAGNVGPLPLQPV